MEVASFFEEERRGKDITDSATSLRRNKKWVASKKKFQNSFPKHSIHGALNL